MYCDYTNLIKISQIKKSFLIKTWFQNLNEQLTFIYII